MVATGKWEMGHLYQKFIHLTEVERQIQKLVDFTD